MAWACRAQGLSTPATRAATLEKLVSAVVQRKKKRTSPHRKGVQTLILVLPDNIKSPTLPQNGESMLKQIERGLAAADSLWDRLDMSQTLVKTPPPGGATLPACFRMQRKEAGVSLSAPTPAAEPCI